MLSSKVGLWIALAMVAVARLAGAQSTTGTIAGRVTDAQDRVMPGVIVTVESPNLQGVRTAVTIRDRRLHSSVSAVRASTS